MVIKQTLSASAASSLGNTNTSASPFVSRSSQRQHLTRSYRFRTAVAPKEVVKKRDNEVQDRAMSQGVEHEKKSLLRTRVDLYSWARYQRMHVF